MYEASDSLLCRLVTEACRAGNKGVIAEIKRI
jgi:hypothetical protein